MTLVNPFHPTGPHITDISQFPCWLFQNVSKLGDSVRWKRQVCSTNIAFYRGQQRPPMQSVCLSTVTLAISLHIFRSDANKITWTDIRLRIEKSWVCCHLRLASVPCRMSRRPPRCTWGLSWRPRWTWPCCCSGQSPSWRQSPRTSMSVGHQRGSHVWGVGGRENENLKIENCAQCILTH